jgi:hypothetical protein
LRLKIKACDDEIEVLQAKLNEPKTPALISAKTPQRASINSREQEAMEVPEVLVINAAQTNQTNDVVDPDEITYHCLLLAVCLLQDVQLKTLSPRIRSLFDNLVLPSVGNIKEDVRGIATRALGLICILNFDIAKKYVYLLLQIIEQDKKEIMLEAFKAVINCIMAFSINRLVSTPEISEFFFRKLFKTTV